RGRRLGDGRTAPPREPGGTPRPRAVVRRAGGGDGPVRIVRRVTELRLALHDGRRGLVPTMGAFHEGHLSLMRAARGECEQVVVSLFLSPAQFGAHDDLDRYPRDEARDVRLAAEAGVDVLFVPAAEEMYPEGFDTWVDVYVSGGEARARPGHFRGVATVCLKLFNLVQ